MDIQQEIAINLLKIKAVSLRPNEPFTWASGIQSPIYCDNRLVLSYPKMRRVVTKGFIEEIQRYYPDVDMIIGTATAGIPWGTMIADRMDIPFGYVRSTNKSHGKGNKIEGKIEKGAKVVVIEDLLSTGGSVKDVVVSLREAGVCVLGVMAIFTYRLPACAQLFAQLDCKYETLSNYDVLVDMAVKNKYIDASDVSKLEAWKQDPNDTSWMHQ